VAPSHLGLCAGRGLLAAGTVHELGYLTALPFQAAADIPGATAFDPMKPPIALAFLIAAAALLAGLRRSRHAALQWLYLAG